MKKEYVMGNGAIALGALSAGVNVVSGYPGTPSSEIIETIQKYPHGGLHLVGEGPFVFERQLHKRGEVSVSEDSHVAKPVFAAELLARVLEVKRI